MADEPILGLFDSDSNFLDELAGSADLGGVMSSDGDSMISLASASEMGPGSGLQNPMMMSQQSQQPPVPTGYQQMRPMGQDGYGGMVGGGTTMGGPQQTGIGHQYSSADGGYNQYGSISKLHHSGDGLMGMGIQHQGTMQVMQQQQFASPPAGGMMQQHAGYPGYGVGGGHMGQQPQQMAMMGQQGAGWNQTQTSPTHPQYMAQQQQQCMQQGMHSQGYMGQHDYGLQQNSHQQHMGHYGDGSGYMQTMSSPGPGMQQTSPMGSPGGIGMMGGPMQRAPRPPQPYPSQPAVRQPNPAMAGYSMHHQQQQRYPGDYHSQHPQMNPVSGPQRYPYPQQHQNAGPPSMGSDGSNSMGHYPNQAPGSYMPPYSGAPHAGATPVSHPPPSSQPMAPGHNVSMSQASYGQSSLQELEQLVSPTMPSSGMPNTNPYQQIMQSSASSAPNMTPQSPIYSSANFQTTTAPSTSSMQGTPPVQSSVGMGVGGPLSPNQGMRQGPMVQGVGPRPDIAMEIQLIEKQIQHLFTMPKNQQVSQQMLDLQERLRILKAQQQQQIMQMQRQQQTQQQQQSPMGSPTRLPQKSGFGMPQQPQHLSMMQQRPRMQGQMNGPPQPQMPGMQQMGMGGQHMGQAGPGTMIGAQTPQQLRLQGPQHMGHQMSAQRAPSQSTPISPQRIQPFQSPTSSTPGDGMPVAAPTTSKPMVIQQAADSMTDNMQMTPPNMHSLPILDGDLNLTGQPKMMAPDPLPATVTEIAEAQEGQGEKPKRKRQRKPKGEKEDKPPKERKPKTPKTPKEPKPPKPPKEPKAPKAPRTPKTPKTPKDPKEPKTPRVRKSKKAKEVSSDTPTSDANITPSDLDSTMTTDVSLLETPTVDGEVKMEDKSSEGETPKKKTPKERKPRTPKSVVKAIKKPSSKKKKPPASLFLKSRKRKRAGSDGSDVEMNLTPPDSPNLDESNKRRSARNTKRKKYLDDLDLNLSDEETQPLDTVEGTDGPVAMKTETEGDAAMIVEKILGHRIRKRDEEEKEENPDAGDEEEFLVKYKNYSYLHCEWHTLRELEKDKRIHSKVKRYKMKKLQLTAIFDEPVDEEYFNPDYVEVDRVLECVTATDPVTEEVVTHYLVKWRSLSYEESTWELEQDVDPRKVQLFKELRNPPPEDQRVVLAHPKPGRWKKQEECRKYKGDNELREYQLEGINWLTFCWYNGQNCILADEMGLGKTIQSITFLNEIYQYGIKGPYLVIVPLSTLGNWQREFETWTDMNAVVYHGTSNSRAMIQEYELFYKDENGVKIPDLFKFHALITTYEIIIADVELLSSIEWRACIIDEAHRLKNKNCRLLEGLRLFDLEHRVLLTGTPLQNNTEELFSLLNFLNPGKFSSAQAFTKEFGDLKTETQVDQLKEILKPMMLRRLKEDVEKNLAPKEETIIEVELTNIQKKYYRAILERNFQFLSKGGSGNMPSLMNTMMELRKCCNHPYLINGAEEQIVMEMGARGDLDQLLMALVNSSGKMVLMDKLLPRLKQDGHKVLIFSQMIRVLDIIEDYLIQRKYTFERLDGRIRGNLRQEAIDRFSKPDSDRFAFLLCTRAGGLGINLTAADTVVIYDSDWNPQNDLQAQARCHRIGQSKAVKVYRLICRNSYEREMFDKASLKLGLDKAVLQSMGGEKTVNPQNQLSKKEVEDLLKKGAYGALMEDDSAGDEFCEEDIDLILQRRTKVIQIESEGKGSTFAKASFSMTGNRSDIDINDPNFWQKWAKKADIDVDALANKNELIIEEPRQRRQTTRYGKEEAVMDISDLESSTDSDDDSRHNLRKGRKSKRGRNNDDCDFAYNEEVSSEGYTRTDCFKVEKHLLVYGWGRWEDIIAHARFKQRLNESDVEIIARAILAHSLKFYKGDERIKEFIWDLVANGEGELKNHTGLSAPVPRGRKGKKAKEKKPDELRPLDFDPETVLDNGYKRHLHRHSNKVLLRVRLLYYIKQEVIGDQARKVFQGVNCSEIDIPAPISDGEVPAAWWDECADRCLLIGVFKHGYEKFNAVRQDPSLCFLIRCGPPDGAALLAEQNDDKEEEEEMEDKLMKEDDDGDVSQSSTPEISSTSKSRSFSMQMEEIGEGGKLPWPSGSDLNTRLRRVITGYQRNHKKMMMKHEQFARKMEKRERAELMVKEKLSKRKEFQQNLFWCRNSRWSRREEADFYRTVSTFGVEFDRETGCFKWDRFRALARLDRKHNETLTEYFHAFYYMCQSVCGKFRKEERVPPPPNGIFVEPITEERASRCLARIDLLNKIRDEILPHRKLDERIKLCQSSFDMPSWWQCGKHDKELLIGAGRHGVARTDYNILRDPTLSFHEVLQNSGRLLRNTPQNYTPSPLIGAGHSGLNMSPALASELRDDDMESDAKSQDSMDLHDSQASSPPPLHNGKVQYTHSSGDNDNDTEGPPKLEPAISPLPRKEEEDDTVDSTSKDCFPAIKRERTDSKDTDFKTKEIDKVGDVEEVGDTNASDSKPSSPTAVSDKVMFVSSSSDTKCVSASPSKSPSSGDSVFKTFQNEKSLSEKSVVNKEDKKCGDQNSDNMDVEAVEENSKSPVQEKLEVCAETVVKEEKMEVEETASIKEEKCDSVKTEKDGQDKCESVKKESDANTLTKVTKEKKVDLNTLDISKMESVNDKEVNVPVKEEKVDYVKLKEKIIKGEIERLHEEELKKADDCVSTAVGSDGMSPIPSSFSGMYGGDDSPYMDMDGLEPGEIPPGRPFLGPAIEWPKDRVIFHRLEHICYTVEHGEWPFTRRPPSYISTTPFDSRSGTPVGSSTPRPDGTNTDSQETPDSVDLSQMMRQVIEADKDFEVHLSENEGLKMTFHKRGRGRGRGSGRYEIDAEKAARVQQLLNRSAQAMGSSDSESQPEPMNLSAPPHVASTPRRTSSPALPAVASAIPASMANSPLSGSPMSDMDQLHQSLLEQGMFPERRRRGRKRKAEKMAELAMAEALAKREQARILASLDPETRVPVINLEDGSILLGDEAPLKHDLEHWLLEHPGYMISPQSANFMQFPIPGPIPEEHPPQPPELQSITGAKAPPLKHLKEWLDQNPTFDVEPKWSELLRVKGSLPASMDSRLLKPSGRGRKPRNAGTLHASMLGADFQFGAGMASMAGFPGAAGLIPGFPKLPMGMPFAGVPGLGLANPMMSLAGFPLAGFTLPDALGKLEAEAGSSKGKGKSKDKAATSSSSTSEAGTSGTSPHHSFPGLYFNPLMYNPLLATQLRNFPLHNFPGLAHLAALNGQPEAGTSEDEQHAARHEKKADKAHAEKAHAEKPRMEKARTDKAHTEKVHAEKAHSSSKSSVEKGHDLSKVLDRIRDMSRSEEKSKKPSTSSSGGIQDLSVKRLKQTPSPAHHSSKDLSMRHTKPPSGVSPQDEQATDLSVRSKPPSVSPSSTPTSSKSSKNKIFSSFKLNKIVDSLKDKVMKIEEKCKKKEEEPTTDTVSESGDVKESDQTKEGAEEQPQTSLPQVLVEPEASLLEAATRPEPKNTEPTVLQEAEPSVSGADVEKAEEVPPAVVEETDEAPVEKS